MSAVLSVPGAPVDHRGDARQRQRDGPLERPDEHWWVADHRLRRETLDQPDDGILERRRRGVGERPLGDDGNTHGRDATTSVCYARNAYGWSGSSAVLSAVTAAPAGTCAAPAHTPGGADGFGGCWPGPANTGVPSGTALTTYTGPCRITANNTVIDSKIVNCSLTIAAQNVTIRNSRINGTIYGGGGASFSVVDSEVIVTSYGRRARR